MSRTSNPIEARHEFVCAIPNGLHARPASVLAECVNAFVADATLSKPGRAAPVNAKSVLSIIGLDVRKGDLCVLSARGVDAEKLIAAAAACLKQGLGESEAASSPAAITSTVSMTLPIGLQRLNVSHVFGNPVSGGIGIGSAVRVQGFTLSPQQLAAQPAGFAEESVIARQAIDALYSDLRRRADQATDRLSGELLKAHALIASDPTLWDEITAELRDRRTAVQSIVSASDRFITRIRGSASAYIRDRVVDVQDVCGQLLARVTGDHHAADIHLERESVVFAEILTPNQLLTLRRQFLRGLILGPVGATSHTIILARSLGIPAIIDVSDQGRAELSDQTIVIDGDAGYAINADRPAVIRYFHKRSSAVSRRAERLQPIALKPASTRDGIPLEIGVNAATSDEVLAGVQRGADGVGLVRTELLFLDRDTPPSENEQLAVYSSIIQAADPRSVILRTLDIGGDKPSRYLKIPAEPNPFLGVRGLRLSARYTELLQTQLRAMLRAAAAVASPTAVKIMAPMVSTPAEAAWFRTQVQNAADHLRLSGVPFNDRVQIGIMIEVPALSLVIDQVAEHIDFFSIGTNDLCQYWMAADRGNPGVAGLCNPRHPSFLRLLQSVVSSARAHRKWIGVCGQMAGVQSNLPIFVGLGVDEISVSPQEIPALKAALSILDSHACRDHLSAILNCRSADEVDAVCRVGPSAGDARHSILHLDLIEFECDAETKEEAIRAAVDLLFIAGRTHDADRLEAAVWAREETYSTGLGYGFAIPHCKSGNITAPTLAVLTLKSPVEWGSVDGLPVRTVMLLTVPDPSARAGPASGGDAAHMKILARLARKLMHESFREKVTTAATPTHLETVLREELEIR